MRRERFLVITLPAVENKRLGAAECAEDSPTAPPDVYTAAAHARCCRPACICAAHAMLPVTGALVEGEGPGDGCSWAARDFFGMSCVLEKCRVVYYVWYVVCAYNCVSIYIFIYVYIYIYMYIYIYIIVFFYDISFADVEHDTRFACSCFRVYIYIYVCVRVHADFNWVDFNYVYTLSFTLLLCIL